MILVLYVVGKLRPAKLHKCGRRFSYRHVHFACVLRTQNTAADDAIVFRERAINRAQSPTSVRYVACRCAATLPGKKFTRAWRRVHNNRTCSGRLAGGVFFPGRRVQSVFGRLRTAVIYAAHCDTVRARDRLALFCRRPCFCSSLSRLRFTHIPLCGGVTNRALCEKRRLAAAIFFAGQK